jgi:hypothetical protein
MSIRVCVGFLYCGLPNSDWLRLDDAFAAAGVAAGVSDVQPDDYRRMSRADQRQVMLDVFDRFLSRAPA